MFSCACSLLGVFVNYVSPKQVFVWLTAVSTFGGLWTWGVVLVSHFRFRSTQHASALAKLPCRVPFSQREHRVLSQPATHCAGVRII